MFNSLLREAVLSDSQTEPCQTFKIPGVIHLQSAAICLENMQSIYKLSHFSDDLLIIQLILYCLLLFGLQFRIDCAFWLISYLQKLTLSLGFHSFISHTRHTSVMSSTIICATLSCDALAGRGHLGEFSQSLSCCLPNTWPIGIQFTEPIELQLWRM